MDEGEEWVLRNFGIVPESCKDPIRYEREEWTAAADDGSLWHHAPTGCTFLLTADLDTRRLIVKLDRIEDGKAPDFGDVVNAGRAIFAMRDFPEDAPSTRLLCRHKKPALG
jgi:hypothetical protein